MILPRLGKWNRYSARRLSWKRIWWKGYKWTPFCRVHWRYRHRTSKLDQIIAIQCDNGNWNFDPYMHGMANGLILAKSVLAGEEPEFMTAPDEWLCDKSSPAPEEVKSS